MPTTRVVLVLGIAGLAPLAGPATAQSPQLPRPTVERAPFQSEPIVAETAAGLFLGFGASMLFMRVGATVLGPRGGEDPGLAGTLVGFAVGLTLGTSLGVHAVARAYGFPARYDEAAAGALAGVLLLPAMPLDVDRPWSVLAVFAVPTAGAVLASSVGSSSRWRGPTVRPVPGGMGIGMAVSF